MSISFSKLNIKSVEEKSTIKFNDQDIEVKKYLPVDEKLDFIAWIINKSADDMKFYNVGKLSIFRDIGLIMHYTNIKFTDKQLEDIPKLYDLVIASGLFMEILKEIPEDEYDWICNVLNDTVDSIYKYQNSLMDILDIVTTDYDNLKFDTEELQKNISNPENLKLLKDVVTKLG